MNNKENPKNWLASKVRLGWIILAAGILAAAAGALIEQQYGTETYNYRLITGLGILLIGIGAAQLVRYKKAQKNEISARQVRVEAFDERTVFIRSRAGNRAYWISAVMIYIGLMWASFADNGSLPEMTADILWFFLAACVVIPFGVYIFSILVDERRL